MQNAILLRSDICNAWDNYSFAVDPDVFLYPHHGIFEAHRSKQKGYVVIPFIDGYGDIAGKTLKLDHITDPNIRPLDELLRDHFLQGVLKNMKGAGEPNWDYEDAFDDGRIDMSRDIWKGKEGQAHFEFEMANRLHDLVEQLEEEQEQEEHS
jgi:hypothetical protein